jgi:hypothetical protein
MQIINISGLQGWYSSEYREKKLTELDSLSNTFLRIQWKFFKGKIFHVLL